MPFPRNPFFTGREDELTRLHQALTTTTTAAVTQAIAGLGGLGKTQLAVEYAYRHRADYTAVLWARADSPEALRAAYLQIAAELDLPQRHEPDQSLIVNAVIRWLATTPGYLLILDNADDPHWLRDLLPPAPAGYLLITSRADRFAVLNVKSPLRLDTLPPEEALAFLLSRTERTTASPSEVGAARQLATDLGCLPLALEQAAAYIANEQVTFAAYRATYQRQNLKLLETYGPEAGPHRQTVCAVWSLNMDAVTKEQPAADLLTVCAFLSPDAIPYEIFLKGADHLGPALQAALSAANEDLLTLNHVARPLLRYSLLSADPEAQTFRIHRMVQAVVRDRFATRQQQEWVKKIIIAVASCAPGFDYNKWPDCERLRIHWQVCTDHIDYYHIETIGAATLLNQNGCYLNARVEYDKAKPLLQRALSTYEKTVGPNCPETATCLTNLALLYQNQGLYAKAEPLFQRALHIYEETLGANHLDTATSINNLAGLYYSQYRYSEAESLCQNALNIREEALGSDHPDTATSINNLAGLFLHQQRYLEAELLFQRALVLRERARGADHPDTAASLNNLAMLYSMQQRYPEAELFFQRALSIFEKALGVDHPVTATCYHNLAGLFLGQERYSEAELLLLRAVSLRDKALGADHPDTTASLNLLAVAYVGQQRYPEAELLFLRTLNTNEKAYGGDHPNTAQILSGLTELYLKQGKFDEAEQTYAKALAIYHKLFGIENPITASFQKAYTAALLARNTATPGS